MSKSNQILIGNDIKIPTKIISKQQISNDTLKLTVSYPEGKSVLGLPLGMFLYYIVFL